LFDPAAEGRDFISGERFAFRGHSVVGVGGRYAAEEFARFRLAGDKQWLARVTRCRSAVGGDQAQAAGSAYAAVAPGAVLLEDGLNVTSEIDFSLGEN